MRNAISPCDPPPQSVAYVAVPSVGVLACVAVTRDIVVKATLRRPVMFCVPRLLAFSPSLAVPGVLPLRNRNCFWPRSLSSFSFSFSFPGVGRSDLLFYLYSSAVVILLHEEEREEGRERAHLCPHLWTLASRRRRRSWMAFLSFSPFLPKESTPMTSAAFKVPT